MYKTTCPNIKLIDTWIRTYKQDLKTFDSYLSSVFQILGDNDVSQEKHSFKRDLNINKTDTLGGNTNDVSARSRSRKKTRANGRIRNMARKSERGNRKTLGFETNSQKITTKRPGAKKNYKRGFGCALPVSYDSCSSIMPSTGRYSKVSFRKIPSYNTVQAQDREAIEQFTMDPVHLGRNMLYLLSGAALNSALCLGIIPQDVSLNYKPDLKRLSVSNSTEVLKKDTNSGFPLFGRKNDIEIIGSTRKWMNQTLRRPTFYKFSNQFIKVAKSMKDGVFSDLTYQATYIMHRFQISAIEPLSNKFDVKTRPVWCVPFNIVGFEAMFFYPLLEKVKDFANRGTSSIFPIGFNQRKISNRVILPINRFASRRIDYVAKSFDYSKFDRNVHPFITCLFYCIVATRFNFSVNEKKIYDALRIYTCYTPFVYDGKVYVTRRGLCSGSYTTNIRDSFFNLTLISASLQLHYGDAGDKYFNNVLAKIDDLIHNFRKDITSMKNIFFINGFSVYGDDGIGVNDADFFYIFTRLSSELDLTITFQDRHSDGSIFFLGRFWDLEGKPWQSEYYMAAHIMFRARWYKKNKLNFNISEDLDLFRILSICCPFKNGQHFLYDNFSRWGKFKDFINGKRKGFYLLKEWPADDYQFIDRKDAFKFFNY